MKHSIVYKSKDRYASFPLLTKLDDRILIGFFTAPRPDHMGVYWWNTFESFDQGETWKDVGAHGYIPWHWPALSPREISDRYTYELNDKQYATGSPGFHIQKGHKTKKSKIIKSNTLFVRSSSNNWKSLNGRAYQLPFVDIIVTFPRPLEPIWLKSISLIPAYAVLPNGQNRAFAWLSEDCGKSWNLYNMFPDECSINEMAFIWVGDRILAHLRSDEHPYIMESWSKDGIIWTYPTNITDGKKSIIGGPSHLLRLNDGKILLTYGYRQQPMGIQARISDNEGDTWSEEIVLRNDGGYLSSLHKESFMQKWTIFGRKTHPGNDIGYPVSIQLDDESILTAYYITCEDRITGIETTKWKI